MSVNCNADALVDGAKCIECGIPPGAQLPVIISLLCTIANNGGGGGSGTVTSFSAGNLAPLFTTTVTNPTTTPALSFTLTSQSANLFFVGPTTGAAAAPTFRAMVSADLGTTLRPQFAQLGVGTAPAGTIALNVDATALGPGITTNAFQVTHPGAAASDVSVFQCDSTNGNPYFTMGQVAVNGGAIIQFVKGGSPYLQFAVHGTNKLVRVDSNGNLITTSGLIQSQTDVIANTGIFKCQANNGISQTFDIGGGNTQITFVGGIATAIA